MADDRMATSGAPGPEDPEDTAGTGAVPYKLRRADQIGRFFDGLEFVTPGLVRCPQWRPEAGQADGAPDVPTLAGVARKP